MLEPFEVNCARCRKRFKTENKDQMLCWDCIDEEDADEEDADFTECKKELECQ
jgi:hypothetical protein